VLHQWRRTVLRYLDDKYDVRVWTHKDIIFYPSMTAPPKGAFSARPIPEVDQRLISRIKTAYGLALEHNGDIGASPWARYASQAKTLHEALIAGTNDSITALLTDPINTKLFFGFHSLAIDLNIGESMPGARPLADWSAKQILDSMIRLAEATGAIRF